MRFYHDALEMIKETERDLAEMGTQYQSYSVQDKIVEDDESFITKEIIGYDYRLISRNNAFEGLDKMLDYKKDNNFVKWTRSEAEERLFPTSNKNPGIAWMERSNFWEQFLRSGLFSYTYVERWQEQLAYIVNELKLHPNSRQAIMTMYDRHQDMMNWGGFDRVPCSLTYHFLIRDDFLHVIYSQRSCDFVNFFQADIYCTIRLQYWLADTLFKQVGNFTHCINSLHAFKKDMEGIF